MSRTTKRNRPARIGALVSCALLIASATACTSDDRPAEADGTESATQARYDVLIRGGTVVDGSGTARFVGDVGIRGDRIVAVSREGIEPEEALMVLEASGLVVSPGFIDNHAHIETSIHRFPLAENFTRQGITSIVASLHSGNQPWPLEAYASSLEVAVNVGFFAGHTWTRRRVMGLDDRAPTAAEMDHMKALVDSTMSQGALGLATGLLYVPGNFAATEEIVELAKVAAAQGGIYVSHMRNEARGLIQSVEELIRIASEARIPAQINHHKATGAGQWGWSERTLALIDSARGVGLDIQHDLYPYTASSTGSRILFPQWVLAGGPEAMAARFDDPALRPRIEREMREIILLDRAGNDMSRIQFRVLDSDPSYNGRRLSDLLADRGLPNDVDAAIPVLIELEQLGGFSAIYHSMDEADLIRILQHPWSMIETDGDNIVYGEGFPHPRSYGAFPRVLGRYVRDLGVIDLETAIHKMTRMPALQVGQIERGLIAEGLYADITVFDPATIADLGTYVDPHRYPVGVRHLVVNGSPVIRDGSFTGERPGRWLRGPARPDLSAAARTP